MRALEAHNLGGLSVCARSWNAWRTSCRYERVTPKLRLKVEGMNALEAMEATMKEMGYDPNAHTPLTDEEYDD